MRTHARARARTHTLHASCILSVVGFWGLFSRVNGAVTRIALSFLQTLIVIRSVRSSVACFTLIVIRSVRSSVACLILIVIKSVNSSVSSLTPTVIRSINSCVPCLTPTVVRSIKTCVPFFCAVTEGVFPVRPVSYSVRRLVITRT